MRCVRAVAWRPQSYSAASLSAPPPASHSSRGRSASRHRWSECARVLKTPDSPSPCTAKPRHELSASPRRNQTQTFFPPLIPKRRELCPVPFNLLPSPRPLSMATWLCHCQQFAEGVGRESRLHSTLERLGFLIPAAATKSDQLALARASHTTAELHLGGHLWAALA